MIGISFSSLIVSATPAPAQGTSSSAEDCGRGLAEVVVTAQWVEETLQDAALPINAAAGEEPARLGLYDAALLKKILPAPFVTAGGVDKRPETDTERLSLQPGNDVPVHDGIASGLGRAYRVMP